MGTYLEWMTTAGIEVYIIIGIFVFTLFGGVAMGIMRGRRKLTEMKLPSAPAVQTKGEKPEQTKSVLGTGSFNCMCFKPNNVIDFSTIPEPLGEIYQFEPSCPISGAGYVVKQDADGKITDYDPREVEVHIEQTPEYAWFATHWDIVTRNFWTVPVQWWKSTATWFAVIMMIIVFICSLVVFD